MGKRSRKEEVRNRWEGLWKEIKAETTMEEDEKLRKQREAEMDEEGEDLKKEEETPQERNRC